VAARCSNDGRFYASVAAIGLWAMVVIGSQPPALAPLLLWIGVLLFLLLGERTVERSNLCYPPDFFDALIQRAKLPASRTKLMRSNTVRVPPSATNVPTATPMNTSCTAASASHGVLMHRRLERC
jgi:hypothetical protein